MLQAFLVLPAFALVYLWAGQPAVGKRIWQLLAGTGALVVAAGWWVVIDLLTPAAGRPYVGGSTDNNILQLTFGYNGLGRLDGSENSLGGGGALRGLGEGAARRSGRPARTPAAPGRPAASWSGNPSPAAPRTRRASGSGPIPPPG